MQAGQQVVVADIARAAFHLGRSAGLPREEGGLVASAAHDLQIADSELEHGIGRRDVLLRGIIERVGRRADIVEQVEGVIKHAPAPLLADGGSPEQERVEVVVAVFVAEHPSEREIDLEPE